MGSSTSYPVSPPDQRCIWMSAGILAYQLCDRSFDCAGCPLDKAMRNTVRDTGTKESRVVSRRVDPLRPGRYFTQEHCWISIRTADTVRIGLEPNLAHRCRGSVGISMPPVGREVPARSPVVWVRFVQGMIPVRLPFPLRTVSVNRMLAENPDLMAVDPYDEGWLFEAHIDRPVLEACRLMTSWMAEKVYTQDEQEFFRNVRETGGSLPKPAGDTAYDGGEAGDDLPAVLGNARYCVMVSQVYCKT